LRRGFQAKYLFIRLSILQLAIVQHGTDHPRCVGFRSHGMSYIRFENEPGFLKESLKKNRRPSSILSVSLIFKLQYLYICS